MTGDAGERRFTRARLLLEQGRTEMAEEELRAALAEFPENGEGHALHALVLVSLERTDAAEEAAERAVGLAPDADFAHYAHGYVLLLRNKTKQALAAADEAVRLDPEDEDNFVLHARIHLVREDYKQTLAAAEQALSLDPENADAEQLKSIALMRLGRADEALAAADRAISADPDDSTGHAVRGWSELAAGRHREALEHFKEALRLDPEDGYAKEGLVTALKARYLLYRVVLRIFLWLGRFSGRTQLALIVGAYLVVRFLRGYSREHPEFAPYVMPITLLWVTFIVASWVADPLLNLFLALNPYGRYALSRDDRLAAYIFGGICAVALTCVVVYATAETAHVENGAFVTGGVTVVMFPAVSSLFAMQRGTWTRKAMTLYTLGLAALGLAGVLAYWFSDPETGARTIAVGLCILAFVGGVAGSWIGVGLGVIRARR